MSIKKNDRNVFLYSLKNASDEDLLTRYREGDEEALGAMLERFFAMRFYSARTVAPTLCEMLSEWELNEAVYHAFYKAVQSFQLGKARFLTFYHTILKHELCHLVAERIAMAPHGIVSLDEYVENDKGDGGYVLGDSISSNDVNDDPKEFLHFAERLMELRKLPKKIDPIAISLVELVSQGVSVAEAARMLDIEDRKARYVMRKYRAWALESARKVYGLSPEQEEEKGKLLDRFLRLDDGEE